MWAVLALSSSCRGRHRLFLLSSALFAALYSHLCDFCDSRCPDPLIASFSRSPSSHLVHFLYTGVAGSVSAKFHIVYRFHRVFVRGTNLLDRHPSNSCSVVKVFFFLLPSISWHVICAGGNASFVLVWPLEGFLLCRVLWLCSPCVYCVFVASSLRMPLCARLQRSGSSF